jgi:hypothetical protein
VCQHAEAISRLLPNVFIVVACPVLSPLLQIAYSMENIVCEINHVTYYKNHVGLEHVYPSLEARWKTLEKETKKQELKAQSQQD